MQRFFQSLFCPPLVGGHDIVRQLHNMEKRLMAAIDDLRAAVARETEVEDSIIVLLKGISQQLKDAQAANDPAAIAEVIAKLDANTARLSAAVTENTPAA